MESIALPAGSPSETVIEDALRKHLDSKSDTELLLRRFDQVQRDMARDHRDLELLSEAFGQYMRLWFTAHAPSMVEPGKGAARAAGETPYRSSRNTWARSSRVGIALWTMCP